MSLGVTEKVQARSRKRSYPSRLHHHRHAAHVLDEMMNGGLMRRSPLLVSLATIATIAPIRNRCTLRFLHQSPREIHDMASSRSHDTRNKTALLGPRGSCLAHLHGAVALPLTRVGLAGHEAGQCRRQRSARARGVPPRRDFVFAKQQQLQASKQQQAEEEALSHNCLSFLGNQRAGGEGSWQRE